MTRGHLYNVLLAAGLRGVNLVGLADDYYETVSAVWVLKNYAAWLAARPPELLSRRDIGGGLTVRTARWLPNASDCDNLALGLMVHGQIGNALAAARRNLPRGGLAFGVLFYFAEQRVRGGHAINWFINHDGVVCFFEPGTGDLVDLNPTERASVTTALAA